MAKKRVYGPVFDRALAGKGGVSSSDRYTKGGKSRKRKPGGGRKKGKRKLKGQIPLPILKKRLLRLSSIVSERNKL